jgi:pyruvate,water dikinase
MAKKWIAWFDEVGKEDITLVGSKNANLGEMLRKGMPVPPGFAVTTEAFKEFMGQVGITTEIEQYLARFPDGPQTPTEFKETSEFIQGVILKRELPREVQEAIVSAYRKLNQRLGQAEVAVAVRSSGVAEDLPTASFAGQYDSYLNVRGEKELLNKVKRCWASLFTARAIMYRIKNNLPVLGILMSVGVQKMVEARSAGVGFTVHPGTGDDTKILIEGNWGTGESVVQGLVTPDIFVVDKEALTIEERGINCKLKQVAIGEKGTEECDIPADKQAIPCLSDEEAVKIAEFIKAVEQAYGIPLDLEWAVDETLPFPQSIFLVQARPVTKVAEKKDAIDRILDMILGR